MNSLRLKMSPLVNKDIYIDLFEYVTAAYTNSSNDNFTFNELISRETNIKQHNKILLEPRFVFSNECVKRSIHTRFVDFL